MDGPNNGIVLYHYSFSPYARRVLWYLSLRNIDFAQCIQPPGLPRPDLQALGVNYRRIPIMAIGRDVYCDSRLILRKLEMRFPDNRLGASEPDKLGIELLLQAWTVDAGIFARASQLIPADMPLMNDPKFLQDREDFTGRPWSKSQQAANRPEAVAHIRSGFTLLETTLLADGREWILKTAKPSLADIEGVWAFHWLDNLKGALPREIISEKEYPKVFAWIARFDKEVKAAKASAPKPTTLKGDAALARISHAKYAEGELSVDESDPLGLKKGATVSVHPVDSGFRQKDIGTLVGLDEHEVVIALQGEGIRPIRLHTPRQNFRIALVKESGSAKL